MLFHWSKEIAENGIIKILNFKYYDIFMQKQFIELNVYLFSFFFLIRTEKRLYASFISMPYHIYYNH